MKGKVDGEYFHAERGNLCRRGFSICVYKQEQLGNTFYMNSVRKIKSFRDSCHFLTVVFIIFA